ncbi:MAG: nucleoside recognition family protein [Clostridiaceae bacterium]|nr:nucleoside recognition family protein [Clostridiaceae bacterium]
MQTVVELITRSGETAVNLALYILLPVMVVMMAFMRVLENKGILAAIAIKLSPILIVFGLPGLGVFAMMQILLVSFAAPISTLKIMEHDETISNRKIAATLGAVFVMSQANATFPLAVVGLNLPIIILTSILGALLSGYLAYIFYGNDPKDNELEEGMNLKGEVKEEKEKFIPLLFKGGGEGLEIVKKAVAPLILSILMVNILREVGAIDFVETLLAPILTRVGIPGVAVLPMATKYLAGGTAMMAITLDLVTEGSMTALELNRIAGFTINTFDPVGIALLVSAGSRVASVTKPAMKAAVIGILFRGIIHLIIF